MKVNSFHQRKLLEKALCVRVTAVLQKAIENRGSAYMLVSGGTTPSGLFTLMSHQNIDWGKVYIGLVDERFVPQNHEKSNERFVVQTLTTHLASTAKFIPMVYDSQNEMSNIIQARKVYSTQFPNVDIVLLGMGEDGHTASLFPNDDASMLGLNDNCQHELIQTIAPTAPQRRISCTKNFLLNSSNIFLIIFGETKMNVLNHSAELQLPIHSFIHQTNTNCEVYYSKS